MVFEGEELHDGWLLFVFYEQVDVAMFCSVAVGVGAKKLDGFDVVFRGMPRHCGFDFIDGFHKDNCTREKF